MRDEDKNKGGKRERESERGQPRSLRESRSNLIIPGRCSWGLMPCSAARVNKLGPSFATLAFGPQTSFITPFSLSISAFDFRAERNLNKLNVTWSKVRITLQIVRLMFFHLNRCIRQRNCADDQRPRGSLVFRNYANHVEFGDFSSY